MFLHDAHSEQISISTPNVNDAKEERRRLLARQHFAKDRDILLAKLRRYDVGVQPAANQIVRLIVGQRFIPFANTL
jgi:hypothetical protein